MLHKYGFEESVVLNQPGSISDLIGFDVLVAQAPLAVKRFKVDELRNHLSEKLPKYMVPSTYIHLDALPLTPNGKIDRQALLEVDIQAPETDVVLPQNEIEQTIAQIVGKVIQLETVGIHNKFFELGADSLQLVRIHQKLQDALEKYFPLVEMFNHPTVNFLANYLSSVSDDDPSIDSDPQIAERATKSEELRQRRKKRRQKNRKSR